MSDPVIKGAKRPTPRPATRSASSASAAKGRKLPNAAKPLAKTSGAAKPPVRKATKKTTSAGKTSAGKAPAKATKAKQPARPAKKSQPAKPAARQSAKPSTKQAARPVKRPAAAPAKRPAQAPASAKSKTARPASQPAPAPRPAPRPKPSQDEMAAIRSFERAHKEFARGRFGDARQMFRALIEQHPHASEVTARARIYLAIAESRLRTETALPRDPDALYDRGVIELNRGDYVAAQELFERALKREPEAAHIHYELAATRARLGSVGPALQALERALTLQPGLRIRAQHDQNLVPLRNEPDYERLVFAPRT